jgi:hypothetical protein
MHVVSMELGRRVGDTHETNNIQYGRYPSAVGKTADTCSARWRVSAVPYSQLLSVDAMAGNGSR